MKELLASKKEMLEKGLEDLQTRLVQIQEQIIMHKGALQYHDMLLKELEAKEDSVPREASAVQGD